MTRSSLVQSSDTFATGCSSPTTQTYLQRKVAITNFKNSRYERRGTTQAVQNPSIAKKGQLGGVSSGKHNNKLAVYDVKLLLFHV